MGTDRTKEFEGPCRCGKGTVHIDFCEVDHGWPTSTPFWYETSMRCAECEKQFAIQRQGNKFVYVKKAELDQLEALEKEAHERSDKLIASKDCQTIFGNFAKLLDNQGSTAAVYRFLRSIGLEYHSLGTFRKRWSTANDWIMKHSSVHNLPSVMKSVGIKDVAIDRELEAIDKLYEKSREAPKSVGGPVHTIK